MASSDVRIRHTLPGNARAVPAALPCIAMVYDWQHATASEGSSGIGSTGSSRSHEGVMKRQAEGRASVFLAMRAVI
jgi:hypothetical protein